MMLPISSIKYLFRLTKNFLPYLILRILRILIFVLGMKSSDQLYRCVSLDFIKLRLVTVHYTHVYLTCFLYLSVTCTLYSAPIQKNFEKCFDKILHCLCLKGFSNPNLYFLSLSFSCWTFSPTYCN